MMQPFIQMEQYLLSLTPRTQRRSQNMHSDGAKIGIYLITSKFFASFLQIFSKIGVSCTPPPPHALT